MLSNVRASSARVTLRSFIASSSRPSACRFRLSYPSNSRTHFVRTLASNGAQLDSLADLISDTAAKSDYNPTPDSRKEGKPKSCSVFLGNLPQSIDEKFIRKQLDGFPGIDDARFYIGTCSIPSSSSETCTTHVSQGLRRTVCWLRIRGVR